MSITAPCSAALRGTGCRLLKPALVAILLGLLVACGGGGSGGDTIENEQPVKPIPGENKFVYSGPPPASSDAQRFQTAFYNNLVPDNRCGTCHTRGGQGKTAFVDRVDVNAAYLASLTLVNLENPAASSIVQKVAGGHNCWEASNAACRVQMISYIENWVNGGGGVATSVKLATPRDRDPNGADIDGDGTGDGFRGFPADSTAYAGSPLYGLVKTHCGRCHSEAAAVQQQPFFGSNDVAISYEAIKSKVDLNDPALSNPALKAKSRLVTRLRDEFHNCWSASCADDATAMQAAIRQYALSIQATQLDGTIYRSRAQVLNDGVVGSSGGRFEGQQIALWRFLEGEGSVISDTSGINPGISLRIKGVEGSSGDFNWIGGGGIQFAGAVAYGDASTSRKLFEMIAPGGEYTLEAWVLPANVTDENREIVAYGDGAAGRNFMLGQFQYDYRYYNRSSATNSRGEPALSTNPDDEVLQSALQHVVATYDPVNGRRLYVNGEFTGDVQEGDRGTLANDWSSNYEIVLGNNLAQVDPANPASRAWRGTLRMVAVHNRVLSPTQIATNYAVPPGEKRYVMFNVSQIAGMPASCRGTDTAGQPVDYCFIYFQVSQYDNYAYLFYKPRFISLNEDRADLAGLHIKGIHLGINGELAPVGQAYVNVDATIDLNDPVFGYKPGNEPGSGQALSEVGTVIPKSAGADADLLFLEFDQIGPNPDITVSPVVLPFAYVLNGIPAVELGWRTFDSVSASFSQLTGVPSSANTGVANGGVPVTVGEVVAGVRQQLPAVPDFSAYLSSHQSGASQLAIAYCSGLMQAFFANASAADFRNNWQANLVDPLVNRFMGTAALLAGHDTTVVRTELLNLLTHPGTGGRRAGLCAAGCNDAQVLSAATAACAAALANAAVILQ
jgi:hypothetical protein